MIRAMDGPTLACPNFRPDTVSFEDLVRELGFRGVEWTITDPPRTAAERAALAWDLGRFRSLEVRYHAALRRADLGQEDREAALAARKAFEDVIRAIAGLGGRYLTLHVGLGRDTTMDLSFDRTVEGLSRLADFARALGVRLALENLAWGWTSRPDLFERLVRRAGLLAVLDIGHARVSETVISGERFLEDFVTPHPDRLVGAHIYDVEENDRHLAPAALDAVAGRLDLLWRLPRCRWWVLELRDEESLRRTVRVVREYLTAKGVVDPEDGPGNWGPPESNGRGDRRGPGRRS